MNFVVYGSFTYTLLPTATTSASIGELPERTVSLPLNAGACVATPSPLAKLCPLPGRSRPVSTMCTLAASSMVFLAAVSNATGSSPVLPSPESFLPLQPTRASISTAPSASTLFMKSACQFRGACGDRLGHWYAGPVPPVVDRRQLHRRTTARAGAKGRGAGKAE